MMSSNLYRSLGQRPGQPKMGGGQNLLRQFQQFRQTFKGDARQQVQQMLNSGQISQADFDNAARLANQFQQMLGRL